MQREVGQLSKMTLPHEIADLVTPRCTTCQQETGATLKLVASPWHVAEVVLLRGMPLQHAGTERRAGSVSSAFQLSSAVPAMRRWAS